MKRIIVAIAIWLHDLIASPKFFRRCLLVSCIVFFGVVVWKVIAPEILLHITPAGASVVATVLGPLTLVFALYQYLRDKDGK